MKMNEKNIKPYDLKKFIQEHQQLWWWVPEEAKMNLSLNSIVEAVLNYGDLGEIKTLFEIVGIKRAADIFYKSTLNQQRTNYSPEILNFFTLYFKRHA